MTDLEKAHAEIRRLRDALEMSLLLLEIHLPIDDVENRALTKLLLDMLRWASRKKAER